MESQYSKTGFPSHYADRLILICLHSTGKFQSEPSLYSVSLRPTFPVRFKGYKTTSPFQKHGFLWPFKFLNCPISHIHQTFTSWQPKPTSTLTPIGLLTSLGRSFQLTFFLTTPQFPLVCYLTDHPNTFFLK